MIRKVINWIKGIFKKKPKESIQLPKLPELDILEVRELRFKNIFYILLFIIGVFFIFITLNISLNAFERTFRNVDYEELRGYCHKKDLSENYAIIVDFSKSSGKHRFYVCDLNKQKIIASSLSAHGAGKGSSIFNPVFSNEVGSNCSSLGHYIITGRHKMSSTGLPSFRLKGLDKSNSNAMKRGILIHSAKLVSYCRLGIYPFYLPLDKRISSGCFAIDIDMMDIVGDLVDKEKKPILLYAFNNE